MSNKTIAADMVWTSLSVEAQRLLLALYADLPFIDNDAMFELYERYLFDGDRITANGRAVVRDRS